MVILIDGKGKLLRVIGLSILVFLFFVSRFIINRVYPYFLPTSLNIVIYFIIGIFAIIICVSVVSGIFAVLNLFNTDIQERIYWKKIIYKSVLWAIISLISGSLLVIFISYIDFAYGWEKIYKRYHPKEIFARKENLPITTMKGAIYYVKEDLEVKNYIETISSKPLYKGKRWIAQQVVPSEGTTGYVNGEKIDFESNYWNVDLVVCAGRRHPHCGCMGNFAAVDTRVSQETGQILVNKDDQPRKVLEMWEGRNDVCL